RAVAPGARSTHECHHPRYIFASGRVAHLRLRPYCRLRSTEPGRRSIQEPGRTDRGFSKDPTSREAGVAQPGGRIRVPDHGTKVDLLRAGPGRFYSGHCYIVPQEGAAKVV